MYKWNRDRSANTFYGHLVSVACQNSSHVVKMTSAQSDRVIRRDEEMAVGTRHHKSYNGTQCMGGCMFIRPANDIAAKGVAYRGQRSAVFAPCPHDCDWCQHCTSRTPSTFGPMSFPCLIDRAVSRASFTRFLAAVGRLS